MKLIHFFLDFIKYVAANFGGIFNLCLGISILSIVELIYYVTVKYAQKIKEQKKLKTNVIIVNPIH